MIKDWFWWSKFCLMRSIYIVEWYCCTSWHGSYYMSRGSCISTGAWYWWSRTWFFSKGGCFELRFFLYAGFAITRNQVVCLCSIPWCLYSSHPKNQGWDWLRRCSCTSLCHTLWCAGDVGRHNEIRKGFSGWHIICTCDESDLTSLHPVICKWKLLVLCALNGPCASWKSHLRWLNIMFAFFKDILKSSVFEMYLCLIVHNYDLYCW